MNTEHSLEPPRGRELRLGIFRNWLSLSGLVIMLGSLFAFVLLFLLDVFAHVSNPYVGILTFLVAPGFLVLGTVLAVTGVVWQRWKVRKTVGLVPAFQVDLTRRRDRRFLGYFLTAAAGFLLVTAFGSYQTYHFTESVQFCGQACHTVMEPELVTYLHGPHARVDCVECHIGSGATWYVKSKLSGAYQVYATVADKYPRPIPTPIKNLRPAQETCEQCHWPEKFVGNLDRTYQYYLSDGSNTHFTVRMTMKVGGGDPTHGPVGGIHWHMNVGNKVEYFATDESRQTIPWVRVTDHQGVVTVYHTRNFTNEVSESDLRHMDCMDCHNRPAHRYQSPGDAVNLAMALGRIDSSLPWVKSNAVYALNQTYSSDADALKGIATTLAGAYPGQPQIRPIINVVQEIYTNNFFPKMNASWDVYPDNIGHMEWPGCFRCHDGSHKTEDGSKEIAASDCNSCHTILAQGSGADLETLTPSGQPFQHPDMEVFGDCVDCHAPGM